MSRHIDWYLVELERMLKGRIPQESLEELTTETRAHLEEEVRAKTRDGQDTESSMREALQAFGPPDRLALRYLKETGAAAGPLAFRLAIALAATIYAYPLLLFWTGKWWGLFDAGPLHISIWVWLTIAMMLAFAAAAAISNRRMILPIAGLTLACFVPLTLVSARAFVWVEREIGDTMPMSWTEAEGAAANYQAMIRANEQTTAKLRRGLRAFSAAKTEEDVPAEFRRGKAFLTPDGFGPAPNPMALKSVYFYSARDVGLTASFESAKEEWRRGGQQMIEHIRWADTWDHSVVTSLARAKSGFDWKALYESARVWGIWGAFCAVGLMLLNALVDGLATTSRRRQLHHRRLA